MNKRILLAVGMAAAVAAAVFAFRLTNNSTAPRSLRVMQWIRNSGQYPEWAINAGERCADSPFIMPTDGYIGFLWNDSFRPGHRHTGLDIFGGGEIGVTPVVAAYDGYLTRLTDWKSTIIMRIPDDPLQPDRQIWAYYTHMADPQGNSLIDAAFPAGTVELFVKAGTRLGLQGNYSGTSGNPTGVHLHFSIVQDDGKGKFLNELEINNTIDPSPYFGMDLNAITADPGKIPRCPVLVGNDPQN